MDGDAVETMALYEHVKRPQWGLAIHVADEGDKQHFQFQDGRLRAFHSRFARLLRVVDKPEDEAAVISADLVGRAHLSYARAERAATRRSPANQISFPDQVKVFRHLHPGGFQDPVYVEKVRGEGEGVTTRKGHRSPAVALAQERLAGEHMADLLAGGEFAAIRDAFLAVGAATDLVSAAKDLAPVKGLDDEACERFARALVGMLDGDGNVSPRIDALIASMNVAGKGPTWPAATAIVALARPHTYIPVRPTTFRTQAQWFAPDLTMSNTPSGALYSRLLTMATEIQGRLVQNGLESRDLVDVYDFIWLTLRPKAKAILKEL